MKKTVSMLAVLFAGFLLACAGSTPQQEAPKVAPEAETSVEATAMEPEAEEPKAEVNEEAPEAAEQEEPVSGSGTEGE